MSTETYAAAKKRLLRELSALGWTTAPLLKVPHATSPDGRKRIWFKPQAIYLVNGNAQTLDNAHSMFLDFRGMSVATLQAAIVRWCSLWRPKNPSSDVTTWQGASSRATRHITWRVVLPTYSRKAVTPWRTYRVKTTTTNPAGFCYSLAVAT